MLPPDAPHLDDAPRPDDALEPDADPTTGVDPTTHLDPRPTRPRGPRTSPSRRRCSRDHRRDDAGSGTSVDELTDGAGGHRRRGDGIGVGGRRRSRCCGLSRSPTTRPESERPVDDTDDAAHGIADQEFASEATLIAADDWADGIVDDELGVRPAMTARPPGSHRSRSPEDRRRADRSHPSRRRRPHRVHRPGRELPRRCSRRSRRPASASSPRATKAPPRSPRRRTASSPAVPGLPRHARRRSREPGHRHPHARRSDSTPMFVLVGQVDRELRGREAFQEVDIATPSAARRLRRGADDPATAAGSSPRPSARDRGSPGTRRPVATGGRPGAPLPDGTSVPSVRPQPARPELDEVRKVLHALAGAERPVILAGGGILRARCSQRPDEARRAPPGARHRHVAPRGRHPQRPCAVSRDGGVRRAERRARAARSGRLIVVLGARLNEITTSAYAIPAPGQRWIQVDVDLSPRPWFGAPSRGQGGCQGGSCEPHWVGSRTRSSSPSRQARLRHNETARRRGNGPPRSTAGSGPVPACIPGASWRRSDGCFRTTPS